MKQIILFDDFDATSEGVRTVQFSVDNATYEIDLAPHNVDYLHSQLKVFIEKARRVKVTREKQRVSETRLIRQWAQNHGLEVPARGRIPAHIRTAYLTRTTTG